MVAMASGQPLGNTAVYASPPDNSRRAKRYQLHTEAGRLLPGERVSTCLHCLRPNQRTANVRYLVKKKSASLSGLLTCGSVWICPVCAAKIMEKRREELRKGLSIGKGIRLTPIMITFTLQHDRTDNLPNLLDNLNKVYKSLRSGKQWQIISSRFGLGPNVTSLEITYGRDHGWHPHKHVLYWSSLPESKINVEEIKAVLSARWQAILERSGRYASMIYGVNVQIGDEHAGDYVGKWGIEHEMTKSSSKKAADGYTPFQLLELSSQGERWAGELFKEYAAATKGKRQLVWGKGSRALLGLEEELTDEELADQEDQEESITLVKLSRKQWAQVLSHLRTRPGIIGELLEVASASQGDSFPVWEFLISLGIRPEPDQFT